MNDWMKTGVLYVDKRMNSLNIKAGRKQTEQLQCFEKFGFTDQNNGYLKLQWLLRMHRHVYILFTLFVYAFRVIPTITSDYVPTHSTHYLSIGNMSSVTYAVNLYRYRTLTLVFRTLTSHFS